MAHDGRMRRENEEECVHSYTEAYLSKVAPSENEMIAPAQAAQTTYSEARISF